ncbi:F-box/WD repeat-containing protein 4 isoform X2 [Dunckerocampus dactyliophorus]|uniref:F-box/WD repeat-containing protein 4 isoform X2 n=1 Tax=Dunckerocampus dactyliophorus TaxID=161453 RepID=UPI0024064F5E|nr:F-box/WD repeat-containing protein 4 isoform X2 [Dunckerocampus dactyliophorus]
MFLWHLPDDVLYHILSYLDRKTLSRLSQVSKAIFHVVSRDIVWKRMAKDMLNTGITPNGTDLYPHILLKERVKRSLNWCAGVCKRDTPLKWKTKLLPWLQLDGDTLYLSQAADIRAYRLQQNCRRIQRKPVQIYSGHQADVCRFVLTDSHLISGGSDGKILVHSRRSHTSMQLSGHNQEINCIDSKDGLIVSGSRDQTTQIWSLASCCPKGVIPLYDRVWSVAINPALSSFVTGTACCENSTPLLVWDVERLECVCSLGSEFRRGAGVLDMVFETPFHLLTCGYDTFIRLWDLRLSPQKYVMEWEEPHDSALYCIQTDGNHMIASGSSYYGVVRLWDKRRTECLQFFQLGTDSVSSPVYSLQFSSSHLYAALATALHSLDFTHNINISIT